MRESVCVVTPGDFSLNMLYTRHEHWDFSSEAEVREGVNVTWLFRGGGSRNYPGVLPILGSGPALISNPMPGPRAFEAWPWDGAHPMLET